MKKNLSYKQHCSTKSRQRKGINSPETHALAAIETRPVEILTDLTETAESLAGWGFLLVEALTHAPWSPESSIFVDQAIVAREGGVA